MKNIFVAGNPIPGFQHRGDGRQLRVRNTRRCPARKTSPLFESHIHHVIADTAEHYHAPNLNFVLRNDDYRSIKKAFRVQRACGIGSDSTFSPSKTEVEFLIKRIILLQPHMDYGAAVHFLGTLRDRARPDKAQLTFRVMTQPEIVFSAKVVYRNGEGESARTHTFISNMTLSRSGIALLSFSEDGLERNYNVSNIFENFNHARCHRHPVEEGWALLNRREFGIQKAAAQPAIVPGFDVSGISPEDMAHIRGALKLRYLSNDNATFVIAEPKHEQVIEMLEALFDHSRNKSIPGIVLFLKELIKIAEEAGSPLFFCVEPQGFPREVKFGAKDANGLLHQTRVHLGMPKVSIPTDEHSVRHPNVDNMFYKCPVISAQRCAGIG